MAAALKKLGQGNFATGMVTFTVGTGKTWQISVAVVDVAWNSGTLNFNVYHVPSGGTEGNTNKVYSTSLASGFACVEILSGAVIEQSESIRAKIDTGTANHAVITVYGVEIS